MHIETATIKRLRDALIKSGKRPATVQTSAYATLAAQGMLSEEEAQAVMRIDPMVETMFLVMASDEELHEDERTAIVGAVRGLSGEQVPEGVLDFMLRKYAEGLKLDGREARLRRIAEALREEPDDAEGAFVLAAAVALADNAVSAGEREIIAELPSWLGISEERARQILDQLRDEQAGG